MLTILITSAFREAYLNPIVNLGQRMVRPVRRLATYLSPQPLAVNVLAVVILVVLHSLALFVLRGDEAMLFKNAFNCQPEDYCGSDVVLCPCALSLRASLVV